MKNNIDFDWLTQMNEKDLSSFIEFFLNDQIDEEKYQFTHCGFLITPKSRTEQLFGFLSNLKEIKTTYSQEKYGNVYNSTNRELPGSGGINGREEYPFEMNHNNITGLHQIQIGFDFFPNDYHPTLRLTENEDVEIEQNNFQVRIFLYKYFEKTVIEKSFLRTKKVEVEDEEKTILEDFIFFNPLRKIFYGDICKSKIIGDINLEKIDITDDEILSLHKINYQLNEWLKNSKIRFDNLKSSKSSYLKEFDKDNNGIVDDIEGTDELMKLLRKHQKKIIEIDKNYVQNLIKVSSYLKIKRENIQNIFNELNKTKNQSELENYVGVLKNKIHVYKYLIFHSLNMISSILNEDLITFYEIYESFDKLKIFNSTWENEVSEKLTDIGDGLSELMFSINKMEQNIVSEIGNLTYVTQESMRDLGNTVSKELDSVNSSIKFNNLLTGISTYQLYQINKSTKSLRG